MKNSNFVTECSSDDIVDEDISSSLLIACLHLKYIIHMYISLWELDIVVVRFDSYI